MQLLAQLSTIKRTNGPHRVHDAVILPCTSQSPLGVSQGAPTLPCILTLLCWYCLSRETVVGCLHWEELDIASMGRVRSKLTCMHAAGSTLVCGCVAVVRCPAVGDLGVIALCDSTWLCSDMRVA